MPLALNAGRVGVVRLPDPDDVQTRLIGQLGHQVGDLLRRLASDNLLSHVTIDCTDKIGRSISSDTMV